MPIYCYKIVEGQDVKASVPTAILKTVEMVFPIGKAPEIIKVLPEGSSDIGIFKPFKFQRDRAAEMESISVPATAGWPFACFASGVNASQAGELRTLLANKGVPTEVTSDGDPVYRDPAHRRKALKVRGYVDKSSYR